MDWICVEDRSRDGGQPCSVDICGASGFTGGGTGVERVSSITAEYFVDLKKVTSRLGLFHHNLIFSSNDNHGEENAGSMNVNVLK